MFSEFPTYEAYAYNSTLDYSLEENMLKGMVEWPGWAIVIAAILVFISILWIPAIAILR